MRPPRLPSTSKELTIPGFGIGHGSDREGMTGVSAIVCPGGAVGAAEVRGSATGTRQFDSLVDPNHVGTRVHAVVLAGGSGFGLSASDAIVDHFEARGIGFDTGLRVVPIVPTAILFDLAFGEATARPTRELALEAVTSASGGSVATGSVGAGTGATVGKARGPANGMKGGFGFASLTVPGGPTVAAAVAVNAFGDVRDPETGKLVAGCRVTSESSELVDARRVLASLPPDAGHPWEGNTTLAVVMTDAALPKTSLFKVCEMGFGGLYRTLAPALSLYDGDLVVTLSHGEVRAHVHQVGVLAEEAVARAVVDAVRSADGFGLLPAAGSA